ncbi:MAG TPA: RICIN domain-containing protein [Actinospica sp.]|nr:RICIN domain-containing protein [Actinospica sp.]
MKLLKRLELDAATCTGSAEQNFTFTPVSGSADVFTIDTRNANECLDVTARSKADGTPIIQYVCNHQTDQQFHRLAVSGAGYNLQAGSTSTSTSIVIARVMPMS